MLGLDGGRIQRRIRKTGFGMDRTSELYGRHEPKTAGDRRALRAHDETRTAESFQSIANRAMGFLKDAAELHGSDSNILVVTHAFLIKTMLFVIEPERLDALGKIDNGSFVKLCIE